MQKLVQKLSGILILLSIFWGRVILPADATSLTVGETQRELGIGSEFKVDFFLDTENDQLNAVEGKVIFPGDLLKLKSIDDGNSIINLWVERPHIAQVFSEIFPQEIIFSGITPGGFTGAKLPLFSLIFETKKEGADTIKFNEFKALLHDGKGTQSQSRTSSFDFKITKNVPVKKLEVKQDLASPEDFEIMLSHKDDIFGGRYFIVFATQDKGSGIDYYEVFESKTESIPGDARWEKVTSPYELKDQTLGSYIAVRVFDKAGNKRIKILKPQQFHEWSKRNSNKIVIASILLSVVLLITGTALIWKRFGKRLLKK